LQEYAENTMNELLGWYGFDGVDRMDLTSKTSKLLQSAAAAASANANSNINRQQQQQQQQQHHQQQQSHHMEKRRSRNRTNALLQLQQQNENARKISNNNNNNNNNKKSLLNCNNFRGNNREAVLRMSGATGANNLLLGNESTTSDHDTRSSRDDDSKSPHSAGKSTILEEKIDFNNCCWCRRPVPDNAPEFLTTSDGPRYCSESCFTQSRRASFKKAKTCDWCKHVRHAVSYVDFQDGASQLQFCSDKCLNQYKMQIFCKETQAHLDMNPHLRDKGLEAAAAGNGAGLITPDLWLRNCRSRSASPASTISVSPGPVPNLRLSPVPHISPTYRNQHTVKVIATSTPHKPLISVAPVSKLMSKSPSIMSNRQSPKHNRKKRVLRPNITNDSINSSGKMNPTSNLARDLSVLGSASASGLLSKAKSLLPPVSASNNLRHSPAQMNSVAKSSPSCALSQFAGSSVQDLHMTVPPLSPMLEQSPGPQPHLSGVGHMSSGMNAPAYFATPTNGHMTQTPNQLPTHPVYPPLRQPFMPPPACSIPPRFFGGTLPPPPPPLSHMMQPDLTAGLNALMGTPPPVTIMVPYPIIIPLPVPIPIPLPVVDFYKAYLSPEERANFNLKTERDVETETETETETEKNVRGPGKAISIDMSVEDGNSKSAHEEPLDFTKIKPDADVDRDNEAEQNINNSVSTTSSNKSMLDTRTDIPHIVTAGSETDETVSMFLGSTDETSTATISKKLRCVVTRIEDEPNNNSKPGFDEANINCNNNNKNKLNEDDDDAKQKLPKFKITRLHTKRTIVQQQQQEQQEQQHQQQQQQQQQQQLQQTKETAECSRPLRKRKRIIDCDFQKISLKEVSTEEDAQNDVVATTRTTNTTTPPLNACNNNNNNNKSINKK
ncbi:sine oculis-binding protein homolog, partial [Teleopsis dalmanni]|uniref:sine oculis-binding protein homolog n=1 Tax=Teleopsis dalmanni TaxID=139649 RepID=UPI0018CD55C0